MSLDPVKTKFIRRGMHWTDLLQKESHRNGKDKRTRPRQRPKSNAPQQAPLRGPTPAAAGAAEAAVVAMVAISTSAPLQMPMRKSRNICVWGGGGSEEV